MCHGNLTPLIVCIMFKLYHAFPFKSSLTFNVITRSSQAEVHTQRHKVLTQVRRSFTRK